MKRAEVEHGIVELKARIVEQGGAWYVEVTIGDVAPIVLRSDDSIALTRVPRTGGSRMPAATYIPVMTTEHLLALIEDGGRQIEDARDVAPDVYQLYGRGIRMMAAELRKRGVHSAEVFADG